MVKKRFLAWGCGVQSTTLAAMSALGELEPLDAVITADTGWERQVTYELRHRYTEWLRDQGVCVEVVTAGHIRRLGAETTLRLPFWTDSGGPLRRECTRFFKVKPIRRRIRELLGYDAHRPPHPPGGSCELWIGISLDEWPRAKLSRVKYMVHRWPLLERRLTRRDCMDWLEAKGLPVPSRSACVCCPYRQASEWLAMKEDAPEEFTEAIAFDEWNRRNPLAWRDRKGLEAEALYLYQGGVPLAEADLEGDAARERQRYGIQIPMFLCESGYCWI